MGLHFTIIIQLTCILIQNNSVVMLWAIFLLIWYVKQERLPNAIGGYFFPNLAYNQYPQLTYLQLLATTLVSQPSVPLIQL